MTNQPNDEHPGGASLQSARDTIVHGDVVGRDKYINIFLKRDELGGVTRSSFLLLVFLAAAFVLLIPPGQLSSVIEAIGGEMRFMALFVAVVAGLGVFSEYLQRQSRTGRSKRPPHRVNPFRLTPSFESGVFGGLIGGALAGLLIGVLYYLGLQGSAGLDLILWIALYGALAGFVLGAGAQLTILGFRHAVTEKAYPALIFNEVTGGVLGGGLGGIVVGAIGGWFFGPRPTPFIEIGLLVIGSAFGTVCVVLGILLYDYEGRWRPALRAFSVALLLTGLAAFLGFMLLNVFRVEQFFHFRASEPLMTVGGAIIGGGIGMVLGLQIGLTLLLYRAWERLAEP
jgi:hypothetical protein